MNVVKSGKKRGCRKTAVFACILLCFAAVWFVLRIVSNPKEGPDGSTNASRIAFIQSYGWETAAVPDSVEEVRIPARFDEAYEQYNALQKEQGFNLKRYSAAYAHKYTYRITNYEGENPVVPINVNLLVIDGKIIGADISSAQADGFVAALVKE